MQNGAGFWKALRSPTFVGIGGMGGGIVAAYQTAGVASMTVSLLILGIVWTICVVEVWCSKWINGTGRYKPSIILFVTCLSGIGVLQVASNIASLRADSVPVPVPLAELDFSFFIEDPKEVPVRETSLPLKDGKVMMEFIVANNSKGDAINGWFVLRVCKGCKFGNTSPGFLSVGGSIESQQEDRTHSINQIFQGTITPKMTAEVIPKTGSRRFQVDFFYRCRTCDNESQKQTVFVNVLPELSTN